MTPISISNRDFNAVRSFVYEQLGVSLSEAKRALVVSRLGGRMRILGIRSYRDYVDRAQGDPAERQRLFDAITTNETRFFREPAQFELLQRQILPTWRNARVWSAGCSSGEEPYSIAMLLADRLPAGTHSVLATDISMRMLERATSAIYPISRKDDIPTALLKRYVLRGVQSQEGMIAIAPEIRRLVRFTPLNLNDVTSYPAGPFEAIFCRNVLIYFDAGSRRRVIDALIARLHSGGFLFLGHAESLTSHADAHSIAPHVYMKT